MKMQENTHSSARTDSIAAWRATGAADSKTVEELLCLLEKHPDKFELPGVYIESCLGFCHACTAYTPISG
ncbi:unnamed protein product [Symbiodinium microadriaticum]|nr:unnamed protein product [Symbiodinium microadriaticum]